MPQPGTSPCSIGKRLPAQNTADNCTGSEGSNAVNSEIRRIEVATQYKAHSLIRHQQRGWSFLRAEWNVALDILPASQRVADGQWCLGTADAVTQNIDIVESYGPDYLVILAGGHIYKQDYTLMIEQHVQSGADVTVTASRSPGRKRSAEEYERLYRSLSAPRNDRVDHPSI